jgi:hypothetical protein
VEIDVPLELDLEHLRGTGLLPTETPLPADSAPRAWMRHVGLMADLGVAVSHAPPVNEALVASLQELGFSRNACLRAIKAAGATDADAAAAWLFAHMEDAGAAPFPPSSRPCLTSGQT